MQRTNYTCYDCGTELGYRTTKHIGCPECDFLPAHSAD